MKLSNQNIEKHANKKVKAMSKIISMLAKNIICLDNPVCKTTDFKESIVKHFVTLQILIALLNK